MRSARYLASEEHLELEVRRHFAVLVRPLLEAIGVVVVGVVIGYILSPDDGSDLLDTVLGLVAAFFFLRLGWKLWEWYEDRIVVTDQRVVEISGILTRRVASMPLSKVTDMTYRRSLLGRLMGYGELVLESAGQQQALERISHLPHPDDFYRTLTSLIAARMALLAGYGPPREITPTEEDDTGPLPRVVV